MCLSKNFVEIEMSKDYFTIIFQLDNRMLQQITQKSEKYTSILQQYVISGARRFISDFFKIIQNNFALSLLLPCLCACTKNMHICN